MACAEEQALQPGGLGSHARVAAFQLCPTTSYFSLRASVSSSGKWVGHTRHKRIHTWEVFGTVTDLQQAHSKQY